LPVQFLQFGIIYVHIIQRTRRQTYVPMLTGSSINLLSADVELSCDTSATVTPSPVFLLLPPLSCAQYHIVLLKSHILGDEIKVGAILSSVENCYAS
jgi:hypothetical protein